MTKPYNPSNPTRAEIDALTGITLLEFGIDTCGHCRAAQPIIAAATSSNPTLRHLKLEDGKGRPLGRSFGVKLWPTLVLLDDGHETGRLVRPATPAPVQELLTRTRNERI